MSNLTANEQKTKDFFATLGSGDLEKLKTFFTEDAIWTVVPKSIPGSGSHQGKVGICDEFLKPVRALFKEGDPKLPVTNGFGSGNFVCCETHTQGEFPDGQKYDQNYCWVLEFDNGLVKTVREYMDGGYVSNFM